MVERMIHRYGKWTSIIYRYAIVFMNTKLKKHDINPGHLPLLMAILRRDGISQEEISQILFVDKGTTSKVVKKLIDKGYVKKKISNEDRRVHLIFRTKKLNKIAPFLNEKNGEWTDILSQGFTKEEKAMANRLLQKMAQNVLEYREKHK